MKIKKIQIENYRLLKSFEVELEEDFTLIIGKNNTGKTSLLSLLEKFLINGGAGFTFEDLNVNLQKSVVDTISGDTTDTLSMGVSLKLHIEYCDDDNLANISRLMLNLDPEDNTAILCFEWKIDSRGLESFRDNYSGSWEANKNKTLDYLKANCNRYFKVYFSAVDPNNEDNRIAVEQNEIRRIIEFKKVRARRAVDNPDGKQKTVNSALSRLSSDHYARESRISPESNEGVLQLREALLEANNSLTDAYGKIFSDITKTIERFGGLPGEGSSIEVVSSLNENRVLSDNTTVTYSHEGYSLPEDYNGLGCMNLIYMIFSIESACNDFKKKYLDKEDPADICLLFIEEPEVHTHPQMQHIFIKNIKDLLLSGSVVDGTEHLNLQTITTTHSPHIASEGEFEDIKYLYRDSGSSVSAKSLKALKETYSQDGDYAFLDKYLTINRAELLFADKAILIEGDTERILMPAIMRKIDAETSCDSTGETPLLSQNISIVEVGAYAHIFQNLMEFLKIKFLVITDIDSVGDDKKACPVEEGKKSSNSAIRHFLKDISYAELCSLDEDRRVLGFDEDSKTWKEDTNGLLRVEYQQKESGYHARSFEDAFINVNREFFKVNASRFQSIANSGLSDEEWGNNSPYELAKKIKKKTDFAVDIIYLGEDNYANWSIPRYIREGMQWLLS